MIKTSVDYTLMHVMIVVFMGVSSSLFYWFIQKNTKHDLREIMYYFTICFVAATLGFLSGMVRFLNAEGISILFTNTFYILSMFALAQGILLRNGLNPPNLLHNKWLYANTAVVLFLNVIVFHYIYDSLIIRAAIAAPNMSVILLLTLFLGFRHKKHLKKADKLLVFFLVFIPLFNLILPTMLILTQDESIYYVYLLPFQIIQIFSWSITIAIVLMLDIIEIHYRKSITDNLTGLYHRHYFREHITKVLENHEDTAQNHKALMFVDIDFFKSINDNYGHFAGDLVIKKVAQTLKDKVAGQGVVSRFGGEEFAVFYNAQSSTSILEYADGLRKSIEELTFEYEGKTITATVSIGVSVVNMDIGIGDALKQADKALYNAKKSGRNRVCFAEDTK